MEPKDRKSPEELRADRSRQAYHRNRRTIAKMRREGSRLAFDRMSALALWQTLEASLHELEVSLSDGSSPRLFGLARDSSDIVRELLMRGDQLRLFERP